MCCRGEHHRGLILLPDDYERWVQEGREDILCYVEQSVYGLHRTIIWKDVQTGEYLDRCPFLLRIDTSRYKCTIQDAKPKICKMYRCDLESDVYQIYLEQIENLPQSLQGSVSE